MARYLGIDYGSKRIGLALAEGDAKIASPLKAVNIAGLEAVVSDLGPFEAVVLGLPRNLDGNETPQTLTVRHFADDILWRKLHIDAVFQDEAATSELAEEILKEAKKDYTPGDIDAQAAAIILQDYLDAL